MPDVDLRSIEMLMTIFLVCMRPKCAEAKGREQCLTARKFIGLTGPRDAQSVMASSVSSVTIRGEPRFRFRARRQSDRNWMGWFRIAFDQSPENRAWVS
jgi:hypothetical protein